MVLGDILRSLLVTGFMMLGPLYGLRNVLSVRSSSATPHTSLWELDMSSVSSSVLLATKHILSTITRTTARI